jgi:hypothetical protein
LLFPALFIFLAIRRPGQMKRLWPLPAAMMIYCVAWGDMLRHPVPPFLSGGGEGGAWFLYQAPGLKRWLGLVAGFDGTAPSLVERLGSAPSSLLGFLSILLLLLAIGSVFAAARGSGPQGREKRGQPAFLPWRAAGNTLHWRGKKVAVPLFRWFSRRSAPHLWVMDRRRRSDLLAFAAALGVIQLLSFFSYPRQAGFFRARYLTEIAPMALPLLCAGLHGVWRRGASRYLATWILSGAVATHCLANALHCYSHREDQGSFFIAVDRLYTEAHTKLGRAKVLFADYPRLSFHPLNPELEAVYLAEGATSIDPPADGRPLYLARANRLPQSGFEFVREFHGVAPSLFDWVFHRDPSRRPAGHRFELLLHTPP